MGALPFSFEGELALALTLFFLLSLTKLRVPPLAAFILSFSYTHIVIHRSRSHFGKEAKIT
jgi:hypothetical protein